MITISEIFCILSGPKVEKKIAPIVMTQDGDKQCVRELRNFLRAALGELHKVVKIECLWWSMKLNSDWYIYIQQNTWNIYAAFNVTHLD